VRISDHACSGVQGEAPGEGLGRSLPEADDTFSENVPFCHGFKIAILAFIAFKSSTRNGRKINLEAEKW